MSVATREKPASKTVEKMDKVVEPALHARVLDFLNKAISPDDLMSYRRPGPNPEFAELDLDDETAAPEPFFDEAGATEILRLREAEFPLGFRNLKEVFDFEPLRKIDWSRLLEFFGPKRFGRWSVFPQEFPAPNPGGYEGALHAAMMHTGRVLFVRADERTLLWNPEDSTPACFEEPKNQPQTTPDAASGYSVLCGGHSFLSDGRLLVAGGGGYGPHEAAKWGYKFDPVSKSWSRTSASMAHPRWYPTVLTLGDHRLGNSRETLIVCGHGGGDMEIYDEATDSFRDVSGDTLPFPSLYPGLHLLPNNSIFYSRTGWGGAGPGGGPFTGDDQSAYFTFTGANSGAWNAIAPIAANAPDRTKGMSVMLYSNTPPHVRILVLGGSDNATNNTYELIDATALSPAANWSPAVPFPDGEHRSLSSAVLLPDGSVFVAGGIERMHSPCALFDAQTNAWSPMAALPSIRHYHSVAILLPNAQVMMAGWENSKIEIFSPPYLFRGPRPTITAAPTTVRRGKKFTIGVSDAASIEKVVLVRPMAVTHQTDTEQKVLELRCLRRYSSGSKLSLVVPDAGAPHSLAQEGYYMLFALNRHDAPSIAKWVHLS